MERLGQNGELGQYRPFEGICLVDTFELAESRQTELFTAENTERVTRQKEAPIKVIIANPPYRVGQKKEDEANKKRKYPMVDGRIAATYVASSKASSNSKLRDPYVRALRWASDRIQDEGVIAFVTNSGFLDRADSDGVRKYLEDEFDRIFIVDLGGSIRKHPHLSGTTHNVFGIKVGVSINLLVRHKKRSARAELWYYQFETDWKRSQRFQHLAEMSHYRGTAFERIAADSDHNWLNDGTDAHYKDFVSLGSKQAKKAEMEPQVIFKSYSLGVNTNRDPWVFNFQSDQLSQNVQRTVTFYNAQINQLDSSIRELEQLNEEGILPAPGKEISWSEGLKV